MVKVIWRTDKTKIAQYLNLIYPKPVFTVITVEVKDANTKKPLAGAVVSVIDVPKIKALITKRSGNAIFKRIKFPKTILLKVACAGFVDAEVLVEVKKGERNVVQVGMGLQ